MNTTELKAVSHEKLASEILDRLSNPYLGAIDSEDLKKELEDRTYHVFDYDPTDEDIDLDEVELSDMVEHLKGYGYKVIEADKFSELLSDLPSYKLRDLFCDMVGVNHHTPKGELMKLLSEKI